MNGNLLPLYWKYINANFYVNYEPNIPIYWIWNPKKAEKRSWLNLKRKWALKLSINQIVFIYKISNYCYLEENLSYEDILIICRNKDHHIDGIMIILILIMKKIIYKINRIKLRLFREIKNIRVNL